MIYSAVKKKDLALIAAIVVGTVLFLTACHETPFFPTGDKQPVVNVAGDSIIVNLGDVNVTVAVSDSLPRALLRIIGSISQLECVENHHVHEHTEDICGAIADGLARLP